MKESLITQIRKSWLSILLFLAIVLALIFVIDLQSVVAAIVSTPLSAVAAALLLATADRFMMGFKWRQLILAAGGRLKLSQAVSAYYQSGLSSRLIPVPVGSELLRAHLVIRANVPAAIVFGSIAIEKMLAWLASSLLGLVSLIYLLPVFQKSVRDLLLLSIVLGVILGGASLGISLYSPAHRFGGKLLEKWIPARVHKLLGRLSTAVLVYRTRPKALVVNLFLALAEQALQFTKFFILSRALGITLPFLTLFAIISLTIVVRRISSYIEGWGVGEASTVVMLALLGIDRDTAVALSFLNYAATVVASLPGAYLLYLNAANIQGWIGKMKGKLVE
jgi:uncharacterized protein (TIRG00374 family)